MDDVINETVNIEDAVRSFTDIYMIFCKVLIRYNDKPWFAPDLPRNIRIRDRLRKTYFRTQNQFDRIRFVRQRNKFKDMKKYAIGIYINNIENAVGNQGTRYANKTFWQVTMGRFMGKMDVL